ncbi:MAG TPA: hypothetical protein DDW49_04780 [Deltaproteobacteria bacterium]|nr:hypothetical protein [Deltaproteobacteria bacterium]
MVAGLKAEKQYGAQAVKTSLAFLKESMGDHFELYLAKARIQLARESAPKGTPSPAPAGEAKVASGAHTEDSADPRVPAPKPAGESGGEKLMAKVLEGGFARDVGDPIANAPDPTQGWLQISPQGEALKLATDRATKDKDDKPARRAPQTLKPSQRRPGVTALSRPWARMNAMRGPVLRPSIRANFLRPR